MIGYHDKMVMDCLLSYPLIPFVKDKRIRPEVHMATGKLTIIFETQHTAGGTITLTPEQFETFKNHTEDIMSFAVSTVTRYPLRPLKGKHQTTGGTSNYYPSTRTLTSGFDGMLSKAQD
jgi:hypothetical protein